MSGYVRPLAELRHADEPEFGGKSAGLGELLAAGVNVPAGFALSAAAYQLAGRDRPIPRSVRDEVAGAYAELGDQPAVAVRSSAVGEDSAEATFAGQQETVLWVRGVEHVCDAIRACWVSLYSPTAVAYRARFSGGDGAGEPAMGVTVQLMVDPEVAGVLFTCNPVSGDPSMITINASWGLGVSVVGGEVTPDDYLVSKITGEVVRERIGSKEIEYVPDPGVGGTRKREVSAERRRAACLDAVSIAALVEVGRAIERHVGAAQDVEWALAGDELFVLQSRPVTGMPERSQASAPASALSLVMKTFGARG